MLIQKKYKKQNHKPLMKKNIILISVSICLILLIILLINLAPKTTPISQLPFGDHEIKLAFDGEQRRYFAHIPLNDVNGPRPIVFVLHGGGGNIEDMVIYSQMNKISDKYGFILIYPEGSGRIVGGKIFAAWNTGQSDLVTTSNDVAFFSELIDDVSKRINIDKNKIYVSGISNGGRMTYRLACELSDKIAAIAPIAGNEFFFECNPTRSVPTIHFHGLKDPCSPYIGGECGKCFNEYFNAVLKKDVEVGGYACNSVEEHIDNWKNINKNSKTSEIIFESETARCVSWGNNQKNEIVLCTADNLGHNWPGGSLERVCSQPTEEKCILWKTYVGDLTNELNAGELMWEFFQKHSLE